MTEPLVLVEQHGAVRRIWLNRQEMRNAQNRQMLDELDHAFADARKDDETRVVVLAGKGQHFSAGHDLKQAQSERADFTVEQRWAYESTRYYDYCMRIWDFPKPTIAQVQGACIAGGFMIANMCDLIVASEDAMFSDPVTHTMATAAVEVLVHPWVMGLRDAKEFLLTGERFSAQRAKEAGMINRVVSRQDLDSETLGLAQRIAKAPPFAIQMVKKSLNRSINVQGFLTATSAHFDLHQLSHLTEEYRQTKQAGLASVISKTAHHSR